MKENRMSKSHIFIDYSGVQGATEIYEVNIDKVMIYKMIFDLIYFTPKEVLRKFKSYTI
jgi:hypothetical protein